jgi:hypothetical protein
MKPPDDRWDRVHRWELEYDRTRYRNMSPDEKLRLFDEMHEVVRRRCPEKLVNKKMTVEDAYRDPHIADLLAMRANLLKAYGRKSRDR